MILNKKTQRLLFAQRRLINILDQKTGREKRILKRAVSAIERMILSDPHQNASKNQNTLSSRPHRKA